MRRNRRLVWQLIRASGEAFAQDNSFRRISGALRGCELLGCARTVPGGDTEVTGVGHLPDFDNQSVLKAGMALSNFSRLLEAAGEQFHVAANRFLGFGEGAIRDAFSFRPCDRARFQLQRLTFERFAGSGEPVVPGIPTNHELLPLIK